MNWIYLALCPGRGATQKLELYTCTTRETRTKGLFFFNSMQFAIRGQKVPVFKKRGHFSFFLGSMACLELLLIPFHEQNSV